MLGWLRVFTCCVVLALLAACAAPLPDAAEQDREIARLASAIRALGPNVDPAEADRAAHVAITHPLKLAVEYGITDPPLIHNTKVNMGLRPRGLCWHWAHDMDRALGGEGFKTLDLHHAIANYATRLRIEHSTVVISARGADMQSGLVLDPWRNGGRLYWGPVAGDTDYPWQPRAVVFARKRAKRGL